MGSKVLSTHTLLRFPSSPLPQSHSPKLALAVPSSTSSFNSSRLAISIPKLFLSVMFQPVLCRKRNLEPVRAQSDGDEGAEAVESLEVEDVAEEDVEAKPLRNPIVKLGDIMGILNKRAVEASVSERPVPDIRTGDIVEIKLEVPENRRRLSIYKGIVMSRQNAGIHTTIRIRRIIAGIGVEIVFPLYSPNIKEIKVVSHRKVRRARLYFLREKLPRLSTFK